MRGRDRYDDGCGGVAESVCTLRLKRAFSSPDMMTVR